jgi:hypothetical protein
VISYWDGYSVLDLVESLKIIICKICCESSNPITLRAIVSPWLRELIKTKKILTKLYICNVCDGAAMSLRYTDKQMQRLYSNYQENNYFKIRKKWEKWYNKSWQEQYQNNDYISERVKIIEKFVAEKGFTINSILDVGGDRGQFIPKLNSVSKMYVLEKSRKDLVDNVVRIESLDEIKSVDLIIYSHVLEHVNNPLKELKNLFKTAKYIYRSAKWNS